METATARPGWLSYTEGDFKTAKEIVNGTEKGQWAVFESNGLPLEVRFDTDVTGRVETTPGDYWTPPFSETVIDRVEINITGITLDETEIETDGSLAKSLARLVKKMVE